MRQLTYISTGRGVGPADLRQILAVSRRNNARDGLTGLLLHDGRRFLQALEGPEDAIGRAIERIRADGRHMGVVVLKDRTVPTREFGPWAMAEQDVAPADFGTTLGETVDALVAEVSDPNVRAQFSQFARRERAAA